MNSIRFGGTYIPVRICVLSGNHALRTCCQCFFPTGITQHSTQLKLTTTIVDESDGVHGLVRADASLCFVSAAQARKLSVSASLGWAEEPQRRHARNSDGDAAIIEVLSYPLFLVASLDCRGTWPIELVAKLGLRPPLFFLRFPPGYAATKNRG